MKNILIAFLWHFCTLTFLTTKQKVIWERFILFLIFKDVRYEQLACKIMIKEKMYLIKKYVSVYIYLNYLTNTIFLETIRFPLKLFYQGD